MVDATDARMGPEDYGSPARKFYRCDVEAAIAEAVKSERAKWAAFADENGEAIEGWAILKRLTRGGLHEVTFEGCGDCGCAVYRKPLVPSEGKTVGGLYRGGHIEGLRDIQAQYAAALAAAKGDSK